jgi:dienelactone hydrolase
MTRRRDMTADTGQEPISKRRVTYVLSAQSDVTVRRDHEYARSDRGPLLMDVYYPPGRDGRPSAPAVVFVTGFRDAGLQAMLGCKFREMGSYISWAQLMAASGLVGVTYENHEPAADAKRVLQYIKDHATDLGIDPKRLAVWSCSGNVPNALSLLMDRPDGVKCAVLCYGYMLDHDANTSVADASKRFGFANPGAGKSAENLPRDLPIFIARAGKDEPALNDTIDGFVRNALALNLPLTLANYSSGPHAFDLYCDDETCHRVIAEILQFTRDCLMA